MLQRFGHSDEDAFAVGLTCGGVIDVLVTPVTATSPARPVLSAAALVRTGGRRSGGSGPAAFVGPAALVVRPDGSYEGGLGGDAELDRTAVAEARP